MMSSMSKEEHNYLFCLISQEGKKGIYDIRPVIKENTAHVVATHQNNILLLRCAILNCMP